jgi:hypothetical protein
MLRSQAGLSLLEYSAFREYSSWLRPERQFLAGSLGELLDTICTIPLLVVEGRVLRAWIHNHLTVGACLCLLSLNKTMNSVSANNVQMIDIETNLSAWFFLHE